MRYFLPLLLLMGATPALAQWLLRDQQGNVTPAGPDTADRGEFGVLQISTTDPEALQKAWAQLTPGVAISSQDVATRNEPIFSFIVLRGCKAGPDGNCHVTVRFDVLDPNG